EGGAQIPQEPAVHPGDAHIDTCGHPVRPGQIGGPDSGRQTVVGIVGQTYDLVFPVERRDMTAGPEDLLTYHGGGFRQPGPDGRLYPGTGAQLCWELRNPAPGDQGRALLHRLAVVGQHLVSMLLTDQRAEVGALVFRTTILDRFGLDYQCLDDALEVRLFDIHTFGTQAHLPGIEEYRVVDTVPRRIHLGIGKDDT